MVLHMTNNVKKALGVQELPSIKESDPKGFLIDWNMNLFNIGKKWFFIFTESESFYSIVDIANPINGSEACSKYLLELVNSAIIKETNKRFILETEVFSIRKTENKAPRCIMVDMIYHAEYCKFKKDLNVFDCINDVPQKLLNWKSSRDVFREKVNKISSQIISV
jgi:hypothetical protein